MATANDVLDPFERLARACEYGDLIHGGKEVRRED